MVSKAAPSMIDTLRRRWASVALSRCTARDFLPAKPHPDGYLIWHLRRLADGRRERLRRPRLKVLLASLRSTLRNGADRRHPSGAADLTVRFGLESAYPKITERR